MPAGRKAEKLTLHAQDRDEALLLSTATKLRVARAIHAVVRTVRGRSSDPRVEVIRRGVRWKLDLREGIDLTIYLASAFEWSTLRELERRVRPGMNVIDVGANVGAHTLHLARLVGERGSVLAFEPTRFAFEKLSANLAANPDLARRVTAHQAFLVAAEDAPLESAIASSWPVDERKAEDKDMGSIAMSTEGATAMRLDDAIAKAGAPRIDLMKMDVDGHEHAVLGGARELLSRDRPIIVMELAPYVFSRPSDFDSVLETLWALGYDLTPIGGNEALPRDVASVRRKIGEGASINVTARAG